MEETNKFFKFHISTFISWVHPQAVREEEEFFLNSAQSVWAVEYADGISAEE